MCLLSLPLVPSRSQTQGSPQNRPHTRVGVFVGLISDQSHTFVPLTNTQVKRDATSFNQDGDRITCWKYKTPDRFQSSHFGDQVKYESLLESPHLHLTPQSWHFCHQAVLKPKSYNSSPVEGELLRQSSRKQLLMLASIINKGHPACATGKSYSHL